jgi:hypothetical protein
MKPIAAVAVMAVCVGSASIATARQPPQIRAIASGGAIADEVREGATHEFRVEARAGEAIDVTVTQRGIDLVLMVLDPKGATLQEVDSPIGKEADEQATAVADVTGAYLVRLRPFGRDATGKYDLRVQVRPATARDRDRAEAESAFRAAPPLLASGVAGEAERAVRDLKRALPKAQAVDPDLARQLTGQLLFVDTAVAFAVLDVPVLPGPVPVYYSRGREDRAVALRDSLVKAVDYFDAALKIRPRLSLAVLARADWERVAGLPYGLPFTYPGPSGLIVMPAEQVLFADLIAKMMHDEGPSGGVARAAADTGLPLDELTRRFGDSIVYHEFAHVLVPQYGIVEPNRWFSEFLANFVLQSYLAQSGLDGRVLRFVEAVNAGQRNQSVTYRSLDDLEKRYGRIDPGNYGWYQSQTDARAREIFKAQGLQFLARVKTAFPAGTPGALPVAEVLSRLDAIAPGFTAWARDLERPRP